MLRVISEALQSRGQLFGHHGDADGRTDRCTTAMVHFRQSTQPVIESQVLQDGTTG